MGRSGQRTRYPGVFRVDANGFRVVVSAIHPRTGLRRSKEKLYRGLDSREAARKRSELLIELLSEAQPVLRQRVEDFAREWMESKLVSVDAGTARTYAKALEHHVLPELGKYWYDALRKADVQRWVDRALRSEWTTRSGVKHRYSRAAVHGWFRVFRTMTKDAIDTFELPRDPCARIRFPQAELSDGSNALTPTELAAFLTSMQTNFRTTTHSSWCSPSPACGSAMRVRSRGKTGTR